MYVFVSPLQVLDRNFALGNMILPVSMALLQYCASPQRYASDSQPPNYSIWLLEPHVRRSWLTALLVILYKVSLAASQGHSTVKDLENTCIMHVQYIQAPLFPLMYMPGIRKSSF